MSSKRKKRKKNLETRSGIVTFEEGRVEGCAKGKKRNSMFSLALVAARGNSPMTVVNRFQRTWWEGPASQSAGGGCQQSALEWREYSAERVPRLS